MRLSLSLSARILSASRFPNFPLYDTIRDARRDAMEAEKCPPNCPLLLLLVTHTHTRDKFSL